MTPDQAERLIEALQESNDLKRREMELRTHALRYPPRRRSFWQWVYDARNAVPPRCYG